MLQISGQQLKARLRRAVSTLEQEGHPTEVAEAVVWRCLWGSVSQVLDD